MKTLGSVFLAVAAALLLSSCTVATTTYTPTYSTYTVGVGYPTSYWGSRYYYPTSYYYYPGYRYYNRAYYYNRTYYGGRAYRYSWYRW
ncbi:hypothetical protein [Legionella oakridgensis]|uniref:Lipoprotein n=2 Tax=Legionella oakridgensis TaxID=29423 RepID=W0BBZ2_9GAMM|nr:hypothetical protein [Legionella oakridgensis]AHE65939.1 hypothetical protein Loa_00350 [Legionella oakridgensis ATCC 33761 = DSM 21215]ETO94311.1 hypothetical protein LOR_8c00700 [Legionella oakridgensis RV-2-2007]KTD43790.1 hypothetical protein Loak_0340 [Legionella oakridgensis]STY15868.1 Uncharacterised protein [Legionella longbeachae]